MSDWKRFFDAFAPRYDQEEFTRNTEEEARFLVEHLCAPPGGRILDVGCGTGRHSVELASRGFEVTGIDLSSGMLAVAARRAEDASVSVEWVRTDAADFIRVDAFDAAICLCEGAMCLLGADDDPFERDLTILRNIEQALRPGGRLILNVLNGCRQIRAYSDEDVAAGRFDVLNMTELSDAADHLPDADPPFSVRERGYTPPEIRRMLIWVGFNVLGLYGGTAGSWGLRSLKLDEIEMMVIAEKRAVSSG
jgi:SAM-dependent methyltransferase